MASSRVKFTFTFTVPNVQVDALPLVHMMGLTELQRLNDTSICKPSHVSTCAVYM